MVELRADPRHVGGVNWPGFLQIARVRAVEESGARDRAWDEAANRSAILAADRAADASDTTFLFKRAETLVAQCREPALLQGLEMPPAPTWLSLAGAIAAFVAGWWFAALGQDHEINLLALPLITIIAWNVVVGFISLLHGVKKDAENSPPRWLTRLHDRLVFGGEGMDGRLKLEARVSRFRELVWPVALQRLGFQFRAWLHVAAMLFAFGAIAGMYQRGWSHDYRAVWESTLLGEESARGFFGALFAPASGVSGIAIPLDNLPAMHRTATAAAPDPASALPWLHLYAVTLVIFVIAPRLALLGLERRRSRQVTAQALRTNDWREYAARLRDSGDGSGAPVCILVHGLPVDDPSRDRWRRLARARWRDFGPVDCRAVPVGGEPDFMASLEPTGARTMLVFNGSSTPETEVHRALAESLLAKLRGSRQPVATLFLALDDHDLKKRWSGLADGAERLAARRVAWHDVMRGLDVEWAEEKLP